MQNAAMISAIAKTGRSIADFQKVVDINGEDAEVEEVLKVDQKMVLKMVNALEGQDVVDKEVHHLGKKKPFSVFLVLSITASISDENNSLEKIKKCVVLTNVSLCMFI